MEIKKLSYPDDLRRITVQKPRALDFPTNIPVPCTGNVIYEWAADLERSVSSCIDSFSSSVPDTFLGYDTIYCLHLLQSGCITFEGKPVASRSLLMLDNIDRLTRRQRRNLFDALFTLRVPVGIWLAERLKALTPRELFSAPLSREYGKTIVLEEFWKS